MGLLYYEGVRVFIFATRWSYGWLLRYNVCWETEGGTSVPHSIQ